MIQCWVWCINFFHTHTLFLIWKASKYVTAAPVVKLAFDFITRQNDLLFYCQKTQGWYYKKNLTWWLMTWYWRKTHLNENLIEPWNLDMYYEVPKTIVFVSQKRQSDRIAIALCQENFRAQSINAFVFLNFL